MKKCIILFFLAATFVMKAQQIEQFSMYMENNYIINPAEAGTEDFVDIKLGYRTQWVGLEGAPKTFFISGHTPIGKSPDQFDDVRPLAFHGVGGAIIADEIGPYNRTSVKASYAYHIPVNHDLVLSLGVHAGIQQYQLDFNSLKKGNGNDNAVIAVPEGESIAPDLSFGVWGYAKNYYFGIASFQIIPAKLGATEGLSTNGAGGTGSLTAHHWLTAGYRIPLGANEQFNLVPSLVAKFEPAAPIQVDANAKLRFKDKGWIGVSYRHQDAMVGILGVTLKSLIDVAYSYDYNFSSLKDYNSGSHEILLGLRLPYHEITPPPAQFW